MLRPNDILLSYAMDTATKLSITPLLRTYCTCLLQILLLNHHTPKFMFRCNNVFVFCLLLRINKSVAAQFSS